LSNIKRPLLLGLEPLAVEQQLAEIRALRNSLGIVLPQGARQEQLLQASQPVKQP
jgi:hypothetical protein